MVVVTVEPWKQRPYQPSESLCLLGVYNVSNPIFENPKAKHSQFTGTIFRCHFARTGALVPFRLLEDGDELLFAWRIALVNPSSGLTANFGNGGAIMRFKKIKAMNATNPMIKESAAKPGRRLISRASDISITMKTVVALGNQGWD